MPIQSKKEFSDGDGIFYQNTDAWERVHNAVLKPNCHERTILKEETANCKNGLSATQMNGYQY